jgi:hypothetical protein
LGCPVSESARRLDGHSARQQRQLQVGELGRFGAVRCGSATMIFIGLRRRASSRRRNSTGWAQAMLLPAMNAVCA